MQKTTLQKVSYILKDIKKSREGLPEAIKAIESFTAISDKRIHDLEEEISELKDQLENTENDLSSRPEVIAATMYDKEKQAIIERLYEGLTLDYLIKIEHGVCDKNERYKQKFGHLIQAV